jgi:hypothetical protein
MSTEEPDRVEVIKKLVGVQNTIRDLIDHVNDYAFACNEMGAHGVAFSIYMISESLHVYSKEVRKLIRKEMTDGL